MSTAEWVQIMLAAPLQRSTFTLTHATKLNGHLLGAHFAGSALGVPGASEKAEAGWCGTKGELGALVR